MTLLNKMNPARPQLGGFLLFEDTLRRSHHKLCVATLRNHACGCLGMPGDNSGTPRRMGDAWGHLRHTTANSGRHLRHTTANSGDKPGAQAHHGEFWGTSLGTPQAHHVKFGGQAWGHFRHTTANSGGQSLGTPQGRHHGEFWGTSLGTPQAHHGETWETYTSGRRPRQILGDKSRPGQSNKPRGPQGQSRDEAEAEEPGVRGPSKNKSKTEGRGRKDTTGDTTANSGGPTWHTRAISLHRISRNP